MHCHAPSGACRGHIVRTARGFVAYDRSDREVGTFGSEDEAASALSQPTPRFPVLWAIRIRLATSAL
jgi:hypothetical protein